MALLRALAAAGLALVLAAPATADDGSSWTSWIPFVGQQQAEETPPKVRAGSARSTRQDAKTPVFLRGVQQQTQGFFEGLNNAFRFGRKPERRPVSGQTRKWKTSRPDRKQRPWYAFWSNPEEPEVDPTIQGFLSQERPEF